MKFKVIAQRLMVFLCVATVFGSVGSMEQEEQISQQPEFVLSGAIKAKKLLLSYLQDVKKNLFELDLLLALKANTEPILIYDKIKVYKQQLAEKEKEKESFNKAVVAYTSMKDRDKGSVESAKEELEKAQKLRDNKLIQAAQSGVDAAFAVWNSKQELARKAVKDLEKTQSEIAQLEESLKLAEQAKEFYVQATSEGINIDAKLKAAKATTFSMYQNLSEVVARNLNSILKYMNTALTKIQNSNEKRILLSIVQETTGIITGMVKELEKETVAKSEEAGYLKLGWRAVQKGYKGVKGYVVAEENILQLALDNYNKIDKNMKQLIDRFDALAAYEKLFDVVMKQRMETLSIVSKASNQLELPRGQQISEELMQKSQSEWGLLAILNISSKFLSDKAKSQAANYTFEQYEESKELLNTISTMLMDVAFIFNNITYAGADELKDKTAEPKEAIASNSDDVIEKIQNLIDAAKVNIAKNRTVTAVTTRAAGQVYEKAGEVYGSATKGAGELYRGARETITGAPQRAREAAGYLARWWSGAPAKEDSASRKVIERKEPAAEEEYLLEEEKESDDPGIEAIGEGESTGFIQEKEREMVGEGGEQETVELEEVSEEKAPEVRGWWQWPFWATWGAGEEEKEVEEPVFRKESVDIDPTQGRTSDEIRSEAAENLKVSKQKYKVAPPVEK